jgi:membrane-bound lytic murein transglycosylase C
MNSRSIIDFERGLIRVEIHSSSNENDTLSKERLAEAIINLSKIESNEGGESDESFCYPLLYELISDEHGLFIKAADIASFAGRIASRCKINMFNEFKKSSVTFSLVHDHTRKRLARYHPLFCRYCKEYELDESSVLAIMHVESLFNPFANFENIKFGIMQLALTGAAREAYRFVYGRDGIPLPEMLYQVEKCVELGCAYLYLLKHRYFGGVTNGNRNRLCSIAAFNRGPSDVAFAFSGNRGLSDAILAINKKSCDDRVYSQMMKSLPVYGNRLFLKNVNDSMIIYR